MLIGISAGLAAGALWGLTFLAPLLVPNLSAVDLTAGRFLVYGTVAGLAMLLTWRSHTWPTPRQALTVLAFSLLGATGYYLLLAQGVMWAGAAVPTLIIGTIPIWVMLLGKPQGLKWSGLLPGLVLTCCGLFLMMQSTLAQATRLPASGALFWWGTLLAAGSMLSWTLFALLNAAWLKRHPEVSATEWSNWMGVATGIGALLLWLLIGSDEKVLLALDNKALIAIVCVATGVGSAWAGGILWNVASQRLSVSLCGQLIVSETLFGLIYGFVWSGAWPTPVEWAAVMLFSLGIVASIRAHT
jgi:drug/metabolite transporter (DMT)-like permease